MFASELEQVERAEPWVRHAEAQLARAGANGTIEHAALLQNAASVHSELGDPLRAEQLLREALDIRLRLEPDDSRGASTLRNNLGTLLSDRGRFEEALALHRLVRASRVARLGPVHPDVAMSDINLAHVLALAGRYREALVHIEQARPVIADTVGTFTPMMATVRSVRGAVLLYLGLNDLAHLDFQSVLVFRIARLGPGHSSVGSAWNLVGAALDRPGEGEDAVRFFHRALAIQAGAGGGWVAQSILTRLNIGMTLLRLDRVREAEQIMRPAFEELQRTILPGDPDLVQGTIQIGRLELALGHPQRALELFDRAQVLERTFHPAKDERPTVAFQRARALWELGRDRPTAHAMVRAARVPIAAEAEGRTAELRDIDQWLAEHPHPDSK
ncbi:MAG: tetratricopeptide repeat protein [Deltaproteobacteria bacterium]|nr:tetratricopeptide repeat protein [Nannocystaceae bacterium]